MCETALIRFWGVRGTIPCPGAGTLVFGGNTACVEVWCGDRLIILDAGSGLFPLGNDLAQRGFAGEADLLLSHIHLDHVMGFPLFLPCYQAGNHLRVWAGHLPPDQRLAQALNPILSPPLFPISITELKAKITFRDFRCGETIRLGDEVSVATRPLRHPGGATGYRIQYGGKVIAYVTDTEHDESAYDQNVLELAENADLFIYDCTYTDAEYATRIGWGHSTLEHGIRLAAAAAAKTLVAFHHDPKHDDQFMQGMAQHASARTIKMLVAREGLALSLT